MGELVNGPGSEEKVPTSPLSPFFEANHLSYEDGEWHFKQPKNEWKVDDDFNEIPLNLLRKNLFTPMLAHAWKFDEDIWSWRQGPC